MNIIYLITIKKQKIKKYILIFINNHPFILIHSTKHNKSRKQAFIFKHFSSFIKANNNKTNKSAKNKAENNSK